MDDKKLESRRAALKKAAAIVAAAGMAGIASTRARAQSAKAAQSSVMYQDKPSSGHQCDGCVQWEAPNACKIVDGTISPSGWCALWSPKSA
jgi:hypothetical protein